MLRTIWYAPEVLKEIKRWAMMSNGRYRRLGIIATIRREWTNEKIPNKKIHT